MTYAPLTCADELRALEGIRALSAIAEAKLVDRRYPGPVNVHESIARAEGDDDLLDQRSRMERVAAYCPDPLVREILVEALSRGEARVDGELAGDPNVAVMLDWLKAAGCTSRLSDGTTVVRPPAVGEATAFPV